MKSKIALLVGALIIIMLIAISIFNKKNQAKMNVFNNSNKNEVVEIEKIQSDRIMDRVMAIAGCESSNNELAINRRDSDGTASLGLLQILILKELAKCESGFDPCSINMNDGGTPSFGLFQYKIDTWLYYIEKYGLLKNIPKGKWHNYIFDVKTQFLLTYNILTNEKDGWKHWYICSKKLGLDKIIFKK